MKEDNKFKHIVTTECVSYGHPDKISDLISDIILDEILAQDKNARCGLEVMVKDNIIVLGGEVSTTANIDYDKCCRSVYDIVHFPKSHNLNPNTVKVINLIGQQSTEIHSCVDKSETEIGAGDQGFVVGYASDETNVYMPLGAVVARNIVNGLTELYERVFGPDLKSQVSVDYSSGEPEIKCILVSTMHQNDLEATREIITRIIRTNEALIFKEELFDKYIKGRNIEIHVNPGGEWHIGGPISDCGVTGRKLVVDSYGGYCNIGGGNMHGKDLSKVDRSGAYMARYLAKNIVAAGLAHEAKVELTYEISKPNPTFINVSLDGEENSPICLNVIEKIKSLDLTPYSFIKRFGETCFAQTAMFGHFGRNSYPWEKLDLTEYFKEK